MDKLLKIQEEAKRRFASIGADKSTQTGRWAAASHFVGVAFDTDGVYAVGETGDGNFASPGYATNRWRVLTWEEAEQL